MRNLDLLKKRAWDELAVGEKKFMNVEIDSTTSSASEKLGFSTPKAPMKDLTHAICQGIFEHYEPDLRKLDYLPDFSNPVQVAFSSASQGSPVLFLHRTFRVPNGFIVADLDTPIVLYATASDKLLWTVGSIFLRAQFLTTPPSPIIASGRIFLV